MSDGAETRTGRRRRAKSLRRMLALAVGLFLIATTAGVVALWPPPQRARIHSGELGPPTTLVKGTVRRLSVGPCEGTPPGFNNRCVKARVALSSGPEKGRATTLDITESADQPLLHRGDHIILGRTADANGTNYYFSDFQRRAPLLLLGAVFAVMVVGLGRWRGAAAIVGLGVSLLVLVKFVLPGILAGENPVAVVTAGSAVIMLAVVYLAHGVNIRTTTALLGTAASLLLTAALAALFVKLARITGLSSEEVTYLRATAGNIRTDGLVLGGVIIGSLGVLNDVTVTQASAVWEIHVANPVAGARDLYRSAMRIGRDHIASTVYTLVLAYAGAALPLMVLFTLADRRFADVITGELVAEEVLRALVGSIGLVAAVPVTTALAVVAVTRTRQSSATG